MTDKEKFRKEVEKLKSNLIYGACSSQIAMETRCKEEAYNEVLAILDSLQEEPVNRTPTDVESAMQEVEEKSRVFTEAHKGEDADTILAQMRGEEPVSKDYRERYKRIAESEQFKKTYEGMSVGEVVHIEGEEPVSEELEEEIVKRWKVLHGIGNPTPFDTFNGIACHFATWQKEQMMAKIIDVTVHIDAGGYPYIPQLELYDYDNDVALAKAGDKYKVILIKEG